MRQTFGFWTFDPIQNEKSDHTVYKTTLLNRFLYHLNTFLGFTVECLQSLFEITEGLAFKKYWDILEKYLKSQFISWEGVYISYLTPRKPVNLTSGKRKIQLKGKGKFIVLSQKAWYDVVTVLDTPFLFYYKICKQTKVKF